MPHQKAHHHCGGAGSYIEEDHETAWTPNKIFITAFLFRLLLVCYAPVHDYLFDVNFTDVDYEVFSDAAALVSHGLSPYERATYRYTPLLAWLLVPNTYLPAFGKILFCSLDILVGYMCYEMVTNDLFYPNPSSSIPAKTRLNAVTLNAKKSVLVFWLINPLTAVISARGNADVIVCAAVICVMRLLLNKRWLMAAVIHGIVAVQLKIYPLIYLPSIFLHLSGVHSTVLCLSAWKRFILNWKGYIFAIVSLGSFGLSILLYYQMYGDLYLDQSLLYHLYRSDTRHNFSPYFYSLYLSNADPALSQLISRGAFAPQAALMVVLSLRFYKDIPFCWLVLTMVFVTFNKVCTSQYFVWFLCLLPIAQRSIEMTSKRAVALSILWITAQVVWLFPAYLFEFVGANSFVWIWIGSLVFFSVNVAIIVQLIMHHRLVYSPRASFY